MASIGCGRSGASRSSTLYGDEELRRATTADPIAMVDDAHPTREGYVRLWLPIFERELDTILKEG